MAEHDEYFEYEDSEDSQPRSTREKVRRGVLATATIAIFYVAATTFAANINLGNGTSEFGQGITLPTACDSQIFIKPQATFDNSATPSPAPTPPTTGVFKVSGLAVSNIDSSACDGRWFTLKMYDVSNSTPLQGSSGFLSFSVLNTAGTYSTTQGGFTVTTNSSTSFTITFATPILATATLSKITLESSNSAPVQMMASYALGDTGPGGGLVFYTSSVGFNCGSSFTSTGSPTGGLCHYLEAAPVTWSGGASDPTKVWADPSYVTTDISGIAHDVTPYDNAAGIGLGYKNSSLIVAQGNSSSTAAGSARAYSGGGKSDWYLPTTAELNLLCQWSRGMTQDVTALCTSGSNNANFSTDPAYWSSSQSLADQARILYFNGSGAQDSRAKSDSNKVRPIRAF